MFGLLWQLGCFFQTQALGHSLRSNGQALGQSGAAGLPPPGREDVPAGHWAGRPDGRALWLSYWWRVLLCSHQETAAVGSDLKQWSLETESGQ